MNNNQDSGKSFIILIDRRYFPSSHFRVTSQNVTSHSDHSQLTESNAIANLIFSYVLVPDR